MLFSFLIVQGQDDKCIFNSVALLTKEGKWVIPVSYDSLGGIFITVGTKIFLFKFFLTNNAHFSILFSFY